MPLVLSKEQLFEELKEIIKCMNNDNFRRDPNVAEGRGRPKRQGDVAVQKLLKKFKKTTLYELNNHQMQSAIDILHAVPIRGML